MRVLFATALICILGYSAAMAESIEGRLVSIDTEMREVTLDGGEILRLTELVPADGLAIGQLVRLEYDGGTVDVTSLTVLEEPPVVDPTEEPIMEDPTVEQ